MKNLRWFLAVVLAGMVIAAPPAYEKSFVAGPLNARSYSKLAFGPDGVLFIADSIGSRIFAVDLEDRTPVIDPPKLEVTDLEGKIAALLGIDARDVLIHDLAVNPISKNTYLTVSRGRRSFVQEWQLPNDIANASVLLRVTPAGALQQVNLDRAKHSFADVANPPDPNLEVPWKKAKQRVDAISDMKFSNGKLYVAGLSNEEFSSKLRIYPFPFDGAAQAASVEIYHGSHGKYETDAPIRTMLPVNIQGKPSLLAAYLCTPLVWIPMEDLKDRKHVKGTTIAEFGSGNYPLAMVSFQYQGQAHVLVVNSTRGVLMIKMSDLEQRLPNITTPVEDTAGVPFRALRNRGVLRADNFGGKNLLLMTRSLISGELSLQTMPLTSE